ncbi:MAG: nuclear transport factor 2 family protein [Woeseiaceae bacterium]
MRNFFGRFIRVALATIILLPLSGIAFADDSEDTSTMSALERQIIRGECEYLVYRYLHLLEADQGKTADLFTEDGDAFGLVGREVIRERFTEIETADSNVNVLQSSNLQIDVVDEGHATGSGFVTHYVSEPIDPPRKDPTGQSVDGELEAPKSITRWTWEFKRVDGEWLISKMNYPQSVLLRKDVLDTLEGY